MQYSKNGSGYHGNSMSNAAYTAYEKGERPLSKWTKTEIILEIAANKNFQLDGGYIEWLQKVPLSTLREKFLLLSSQHHTSKLANLTDFYRLNNTAIRNLMPDDITEMIERNKSGKER